MTLKCWVIVMGCGWRSDGEWKPVKVFVDQAKAEKEFDALIAVSKTYGGISGESYNVRMARLEKAMAEAPAKYAALGYTVAKGDCVWWELYETIYEPSVS